MADNFTGKDASGNTVTFASTDTAGVHKSKVIIDTLPALPAGSNNIGDVDIASALPSGDNNIGNVDIASALPAGDNNIGNVDIASALPAGSNNIGDVDIASALPAGTNSIGKVEVDPGSTMAYGNTTCNGSAQRLIVASTIPKNGIVLVSAHPDNDEEIYIGDASVADETGLSIAAGATIPVPTDEVNKLYIRGKTTTCKFSWYCNK